ncbi:MAG TPA: DUF6444 domain-containing protein [Methanoculleus sp.]|nr:DUF6444 domain-containing protein [Methanoculleus sp.]
MTAENPYPEAGVGDRPLSQYTLADIPVLLAIIGDLKRLITEQQLFITELRDENARLKARIADLESQLNQNSRNSSRPNG